MTLVHPRGLQSAIWGATSIGLVNELHAYVTGSLLIEQNLTLRKNCDITSTYVGVSIAKIAKGFPSCVPTACCNGCIIICDCNCNVKVKDMLDL